MSTIAPFARSEFDRRLDRARREMRRARLDALLVTAIPVFRYFTGYHPIIGESPTRPWFFILPLEAEPLAIIPAMGADDMRQASWLRNIVTWPSPRPDDEGVGLLAATLAALPARFGRVGAEIGPETRLAMPVADFDALRAATPGLDFVDGGAILRAVTAILSPAELARMRHAAASVDRAFRDLPDRFRHGVTEAELHRDFQAAILRNGADYVRYLAIGSGPGGYGSICRGPVDRAIDAGDVLALDSGSVVDGYFCDFDRNFAIGPPDDGVKRAYATLHRAVDAGIATARPGATAAAVWTAMAGVLDEAGAEAGSIGRMGHGLGMTLTAPPSIHSADRTVLAAGMALAIEPGLFYTARDGGRRLMVHEENIVLTESGNALITRRAPGEIRVIA